MNWYKSRFDLLGEGRRFGNFLLGERRTPRRMPLCCWMMFWLLAGGLADGVSGMAFGQGMIRLDVERKLVTLADGQGQLALRLSYDGRCVLDRVTVRGREVAAESGVFSGVCVDGKWLTTKAGIATPGVVVDKDTVTVNGIVFGEPGSEIHEVWRFTVQADRIAW